MSRHPDLLTRPEAAKLLGVPASRLCRGWGPPPLPQYKRPVMYSRELCQRWLDEQKGEAWGSTEKEEAGTGGSHSRLTVRKSAGQRGKKVADRLRAKHGRSAPPSNPKHLAAVGDE